MSVGVRRPTGRRGADLLKGLLALAALAAIMLAGPDRIAGLLRPLIDSVVQRVTSDLPRTPVTDPALPSHAVGAACSVRDERARSILDGSPIQYLPLSTCVGLHWQHPALERTPPPEMASPLNDRRPEDALQVTSHDGM